MASFILILDKPLQENAYSTDQETFHKSLSTTFPTAHIEIFADKLQLLNRLIRNKNYILKTSTANTRTRRRQALCIPNDKEEEVSYPVVIMINSVSIDGFGVLSDLVETHFRYLNPVIRSFDFSGSDSVVSEDISSLMDKISTSLHDRVSRMESWTGLKDDFFNSTFNSMSKLIRFPSKVSGLSANFDFLASKVDYLEPLCNLENANGKQYYKNACRSWDFDAYSFTLDELLYIAYIILLEPFLECVNYRKSKYSKKLLMNRLAAFLFYIRDSYHSENPFHNFRHAVDVLQATNHFLKRIATPDSLSAHKFPLQFTFSEQFALLLAALGHDMGHPAVTNKVLSESHSTIAELFHDESVLENFHQSEFRNACSAFLHINGKHILSDETWNRMNLLIKSSILATDMAKHDEYMHHMDKFDPRGILKEERMENIHFLASLVIKSADISNVCRPLQTSVKWALSLGQEFAEVGKFEQVVVYGSKDRTIKKLPFEISQIDADGAVEKVPGLSASEMFFINRFASEFFLKIGNVVPPLLFLHSQLIENTGFWVADEEKKAAIAKCV